MNRKRSLEILPNWSPNRTARDFRSLVRLHPFQDAAGTPPLTSVVLAHHTPPARAHAGSQHGVHAGAVAAVEVAARNVAGCLAHPVGEGGEGAAGGAGRKDGSICTEACGETIWNGMSQGFVREWWKPPLKGPHHTFTLSSARVSPLLTEYSCKEFQQVIGHC